MLVLSRKFNEEVVIGEGENAVRVVVVEIRGDKARLGFVAPDHISIDRREVRDAKERSRAASDASSSPTVQPAPAAPSAPDTISVQAAPEA